ncbi:retrovirus-related pol polyprotein from transposon TNT 1-94 [Tanacetum coccineum]
MGSTSTRGSFDDSELKDKLKTFKKGNGVRSSNSVRRPKSKDTKWKNGVLKNTNDKSSYVHVRKVSNSVRIDFNKRETMNSIVIQLVLWLIDGGYSKHMTGNLQLLRNFIEKFMGTVRFENDHFAAITRYEDYVQGNLMICHNLEGDDLLTGSRNSNLYTISIFLLATSSPVCLMSKATSTKSWLWHRRLSHLNFGTINQLMSKDLVDGLPKFKYDKDQLCSACEQGKSKTDSFPPKLVPGTESKLELLNMDLCGPMKIESINGKKYILVIIDDYSRYTLVYFRTKDEAPNMIFNFINQVQRNLKAQILKIQTDNGTEFKNEKLRNRPIVYTRYNKTPNELIRGRKPNVQYFHVFGSLSYPTNDRDDLGKIKSKADIDNYATSTPKVSDNFAANTLNNEDTPLSSSIVVEEDEAPQIVSSSAKLVATEPNTLVSNENADELVQEDIAKLDGNVFYNPLHNLVFEEAESSSTYQDLSNMNEFHQTRRSTDKWTKNHLIKQVIGDPSKPVMIRHRLHTNAKIYPDFPNHVYRLKKAQYSLKQALRACKVPDTKDTITFKLTTQEITYTVDMFRDTLKLSVETLDNPFIAPTMFKVLNRCLTTRTSGHDQTKINKLQLFHVVVNRVHVDYTALLWWDFLNYVFQKKDVIQYPCFTNLIIANLVKKFPSIPQRLDEDYHSIKDDILLVSVYSTGNVLFQGMPILDAFLIDEIHATSDYREYETVFVKVAVLMNQLQLVVSTKGTHKTTPRAHRTPTLTAASPQGQSITSIPPPGDDRERDEIAEATLLSLTLYKTALVAEAQENIAKVQEKLEED